MARISKAEHPKILRMVDVERRKVAEVAAEYGCSAANIYALLGKLRRIAQGPPLDAGEVGALGREQDVASSTAMLVADATTASIASDADGATASPCALKPDVKQASSEPATGTPAEGRAGSAPEPPSGSSVTALPKREAHAAAKASASLPRAGMAKDLPRGRAAEDRSGRADRKLAKPGYGLLMRTADGDENLSPFRSLEDLLSAVKPLLRTAARSPDTVWFSIQPVDLATLESDAA